MAKTVGIIGGGPSGLAAAKALKELGLKPLIFESSSKIGGLWAETNGKVPSTLRTNVSKYQCNFSDLPWPKQEDMFPTARQMETYLNSYAQKFLTNSEIMSNSKVIGIQQMPNSDWSVSFTQSSDSISKEHTMSFQQLVIASGIFTKPFMPEFPNQFKFSGKVYHSSNSNEILNNCKEKVVVVVGSSFSGIEACTDALSFGAKKVIHVCSKPFWIVPRYVPKDPETKCPTFLPLDLVLFKRNPTQGPQEATQYGVEDWKKKNQYMRKLLKGQEFFVPQYDLPLYIGISDTYAGFVQNGSIQPIHARLMDFHEDSKSLILSNGETIEGDAVILGTGFQLHLPFIPQNLIPDYEPTDLLQPLLLHKSMFHPSLPGIGFVGMYRGPYFGIIELQAKYIAAVMSGRNQWPTLQQQKQGQEAELFIRNQRPKPQFPHSDYPGRVDELMHELNNEEQGIKRDDFIVIPATFSKSDAAKETLEQLEEDLSEAENGRFVPDAIFCNLHGNWKFQRRIESLLSSSPSGSVEGRASFILKTIEELHYRENGLFQPEAKGNIENLQFETKQEYLYKLIDHRLQVHFVDSNSKLFHELKFFPNSEGWIGKGNHLCSQDFYNVEITVPFNGAHVNSFSIEYKVKGPAKDYVSKTIFTKLNLALAY